MNSTILNRLTLWYKIKPSVEEGRQQLPDHLKNSWLLVLPSLNESKFIVMNLPFKKHINSVHLMIENRKEWYQRDGHPKEVKIQALKTAITPILLNDLSNVNMKLLPSMAWYIVMFFLIEAVDGSQVEIFESEKVIAVDFTITKVPRHELNQATQPSRTLH